MNDLLNANPNSSDSNLFVIDRLVAVSDFKGALELLSESILKNPTSSLLFYKRATIELKLQQHKQASQSLRRSLELDIENSQAGLLLGSIYFFNNDIEWAKYFFESYLNDSPLTDIRCYLGNIYHSQEKYYKAERIYRKALEYDSGHQEIKWFLAKLLLGKVVFCQRVKIAWIQEGMALCDELIKLGGLPEEKIADAYRFKADFHKMIDQPDQAVALYRKALKIYDSDKNIHSNLSTVLLTCGEFQEGIQEANWRWQLTEHNQYDYAGLNDLAVPIWCGEVDPDAVVLVLPEQGIGDQILMCQWLLLIEIRVKQVIYICETRLQKIFQRSLPNVTFYSFAEAKNRVQESAITHKTYIMDSLPYFDIKLGEYQQQHGYLLPDSDQVRVIQQRYQSKDAVLRVGISWRSFSKQYGARKTPPLDVWQPLFTMPGIEFYDIQYGDVSEDLGYFKDHYQVVLYKDQKIDPIADLDAALAQLCGLDLVISVSNVGAHLAAAAGVETWLITSVAPAWHWIHAQNKAMWYANTTIYRQSSIDQWGDVISRVAEDLCGFKSRKQGEHDQ